MDYNIYLKVDENGQRTTAWNAGDARQQPFSSKSPTSAWVSKAQSALKVVSNPDSLISSGVGAVAKAIPWVALDYAIVKTATVLEDTAISYAALVTGDYSTQQRWNNFKTVAQSVFHPMTTAYNAYRQSVADSINNQKQQEKLRLLGDSVVNSYTKRGV